MEPLWIAVAFFCGFVMRHFRMPPLIGFLAAGFVLNALGVQGGPTLDYIADLGVTLLLFSIGLKLDLRTLLRPEVWAGTSLHMLLSLGVFSGLFMLFAALGLPYFTGMELGSALVLGFALSFSSTVFAVKVLEQRGDMNSIHGRTAIGILVMQDILAVIFLTFSTGKLPSVWSLVLPVVLLALRPLLLRLMDRIGHGEMLVLFGLFLSLVVGASGFEMLQLKPDLGALVLGVMVASHPKSSELAKSLSGIKDLFLVGFFLSIGLKGSLSVGAVTLALLLSALLLFKATLFFLLLTRFRLRARSSLLASLSLSNYSEFGLIVAAVALGQGWLSSDWLVILALALSISFVLCAPLCGRVNELYQRHHDFLMRLQTNSRHPDDQPIDLGSATIYIFGMGRTGRGAYDYIRSHTQDEPLGVDFSKPRVADQRAQGRRVIYGDPTDPDFWSRVKHQGNQGNQGNQGKVRLLLLALSNHQANLSAAKNLMEAGFKGKIAAAVHFEDQGDHLKELGVHAAFNIYREAGAGLAEHALEELNGAGQEPAERLSKPVQGLA